MAPSICWRLTILNSVGTLTFRAGSSLFTDEIQHHDISVVSQETYAAASASFLGTVKEIALVESLHLSRCVFSTAGQRQDIHCKVSASWQQWQYTMPADSVHMCCMLD
jgi:hypothetical protein